jgi:ferrous iron transport protein B
MTVGLIAGFVAKEVVISTLGILYAGGVSLQTLLPTVMSAPVALGYLVFIVLYTPCAATLAVMRTETGKARWVALSVGWGLALAWVSAFLVMRIAEVVL